MLKKKIPQLVLMLIKNFIFHNDHKGVKIALKSKWEI